MPAEAMKVTAVAPWFGSNRILAACVGEELKGCRWVGVPLAGGMCELAHISAPTIVVSDLHRHVINLARVIADRGELLANQLTALPFHPDVLRDAQERCREWERDEHLGFEINVGAAKSYFVACWMGRSHKSGIGDEFNGGVSVRWNGNGGDSNKRYRSAVESLEAWQEIMRRCNFVVMDCFEFLDRCEDAPRHGIYCDPPFPGPGDRYKHQFSESDHRKLAERLAAFKNTKVVCRFYDHPLIREIYPESKWAWRMLEGRKQSNDKATEVLLRNFGDQRELFA